MLTAADKGSGSAVNFKTAHDFLNQCRQLLGDGDVLDLTSLDPSVFDWRAYLAHHEDFEVTILGGPHGAVGGFEFRKFPWLDPNAKQGRTDFVVLRTDGLAVRLHPQTRKGAGGRREAIPVVGSLSDWLEPTNVGTASASSRGTEGVAPKLLWQGRAQSDLRGDAEARAFLEGIEEAWARETPATLSRPILASEWAWPLWLAQPRFAACFAGQRVLTLGVARFNGAAAFVGRAEKGGCFAIVRGQSGRMLFRWSIDDIDFS